MDLFSTDVLAGVVANLDEPSSFLLDAAFPFTLEDPSEEIHFDLDESKPRITPFVHPLVPGRVVKNRGFKTNTFQPGYCKDKRHFNARRAFKRRIGEKIGGSMSPEERLQANIRDTLIDQLEMLTRREELMAAEALRTGKVTVTGDGLPIALVDFLRDAALTITLTANDRWSVNHADSDPLSDIEDAAQLIMDKSGASSGTVVMEPSAWKMCRRRLSERGEMATLFDYARSSRSSAEVGPLKPQRGGRQVGRLGDFDIWTYQQGYIDDAGSPQKMLAAGDVLVFGADVEGTRCYGAIQDEKSGFAATRFFTKSWLEEDPAARWMLLQSAPLVVPFRPNATACIKVNG